MNLNSLKKMLRLETAADAAFQALTAQEKAAYAVGNPNSPFAETSAVSGSKWFSSLSPKQQKEYKSLHPGSKLGGNSINTVPKDASPAKAPEKTERVGSVLARHGKSLAAHPDHVKWLRSVRNMMKAAHNSPGKNVSPKNMEFIKAGPPKVKVPAGTGQHAEYVPAMVRSAAKQLHGAASWDDPAMVGMAAGDAADHLRIAHHLNRGEINSAGKHAGELDTASREEIPSGVWNHLRKHRVV